MTEIPEHLLNRSKARRAEASGEAPASGVAKTESASVAALPAEKGPAVPALPKVVADPPYVTAAKSRKKIPFWAMSGLSLLPVWAFLYFVAMTPSTKVEAGPISDGTAVYGGCAGCHMANGSGGAGRILYQGEVLKTFPHIEDMLNFVYNGSQKYVANGIAQYGDPAREGGAHKTLSYNGNPMPQQGEKAGGGLTEAEILAVVCHVRYDLSGADVAMEKWKTEFETWCSPESEIYKALETGASTFDSVEKDFAALPTKPLSVGTDPRVLK